LNNVVEQDHRAIKRIARPMQEFKDFGCVRSIDCKLGCQVTVDHCASDGVQKMSATRRPPHVLVFAHARIDHLVHR